MVSTFFVLKIYIELGYKARIINDIIELQEPHIRIFLFTKLIERQSRKVDVKSENEKSFYSNLTQMQ